MKTRLIIACGLILGSLSLHAVQIPSKFRKKLSKETEERIRGLAKKIDREQFLVKVDKRVQQLQEQMRKRAQEAGGITWKLFIAVMQGNLAQLKQAIAQGANVRTKIQGDSLLHYAGSVDVAQFLLDMGLDVNAKGGRTWFGDQFTPLHIAVMGGRFDIAKVFIARGADINAQDTRLGNSPTMFLVPGFRSFWMNTLLMEPEPKTEQAKAAFTKKTQQLIAQWIDFIKFFLARGAQPGLANKKGETVVSIMQQESENIHKEIQRRISATLA